MDEGSLRQSATRCDTQRGHHCARLDLADLLRHPDNREPLRPLLARACSSRTGLLDLQAPLRPMATSSHRHRRARARGREAMMSLRRVSTSLQTSSALLGPVVQLRQRRRAEVRRELLLMLRLGVDVGPAAQHVAQLGDIVGVGDRGRSRARRSPGVHRACPSAIRRRAGRVAASTRSRSRSSQGRAAMRSAPCSTVGTTTRITWGRPGGRAARESATPREPTRARRGRPSRRRTTGCSVRHPPPSQVDG